MSSVADGEDGFVGDGGSDVLVFGGDGGEGGDAVEGGDGLGGGLDVGGVGADGFAELLEELVVEGS